MVAKKKWTNGLHTTELPHWPQNIIVERADVHLS